MEHAKPEIRCELVTKDATINYLGLVNSLLPGKSLQVSILASQLTQKQQSICTPKKMSFTYHGTEEYNSKYPHNFTPPFIQMQHDSYYIITVIFHCYNRVQIHSNHTLYHPLIWERNTEVTKQKSV